MYQQLREPEPEPESGTEPEPLDAEVNIRCIGAAPFIRIAKKPDHEIFAVSIADIDKALAPKVYTDLATKLPKEYHDLLKVFS